MKKYLLSTLTAAAAMAVPAFSAELIGSWDFSNSAGETGVTSITSDVSYGSGSLTISTGGTSGSTIYAADSGNNGYLNIQPGSSNKTTIDISNCGITLEEGISVVLTIEGWSSGSNSSCLFASIETSASGNDGYYAAGIGQTNNGGNREGYFTADTGSGNFSSTTQENYINITYPVTVVMTFIGDTLTLYQYINAELVTIATATMNSTAYGNIGGDSGTIKEVALGSWDYTSTNDEFSTLNVSSVEIWRGDVTTLPEPALFSIFFSVGALGLVATRRRKRA